MMKQMRENTKIILWIVVISFVITIFAVWGLDLRTGDGPSAQQYGVLGKVNGVSITYAQYQGVYEQIAAQLRQSSQTDRLSSAEQELIRQQAWDNIVMAILTEQQVEKLGIEVTDEEVMAFLRTSPPPEIQQYFLDESGNFDFAAYQNALNNPDADWTAVEGLARQRIPMIKLNRYLMSQVHVGADEVQRAFEEQNTVMTIEYVAFPISPGDSASYQSSQEEIDRYYADHKDQFRQGERAVIEYAQIPIAASSRDVTDVLYTIGNLKQQIDAGADFGDMAKSYSQAPTAEVKGETGFITRAQRDAKVMDAVDKLADGGVSEPLLIPGGAYLVKRLGTKTESGVKQYNIQEIFVELNPSSQTTDSLLSVAQAVQKRAAEGGETGLAAAAKENGLVTAITEPFRKNVPIPGLGFVPALSRFAFDNEGGTVSEVMADDRNYYVCRVVERMPDDVRPLDSVRDRIIAELAYERDRASTLRKAEAFHRRLETSQTTFAKAAEDYRYTIRKPKPFRVAEPVDDLPPNSAVAFGALKLPRDGVMPPVESHGAFYVVRLVDKTPADEQQLRANAPAIAQRLRDEKTQAYISYWLEQIKTESKIEDFRGAL